LNGTANANGGSYSLTFEYGTTTSYGTTWSATPGSVSGSTTTAVSGTPTNLLPNTTYHFRLRTTTGIAGADMTFTTAQAATPPTLTTGAASSISSYSVSLRANNVFSGSSRRSCPSTTARAQLTE
jgi:hypothetical protein